MNSKQIECFFNVAKSLNFTEVADKMFTSQSNVSRYISQLEEELDMKLFIRGNNYVRLTPSGAVMLDAFEQVKEFLDEQIKFAGYTEKGESGYLKIGFLSFMELDKFFMETVNKFKKNYPAVIIDYIIVKNNKLYDLTNKNVDLIIAPEVQSPPTKNFLSKRISYSQMFLLYSKNHKLYGKKDLCISDFKNDIVWTTKSVDTPARNKIVKSIMSYYNIKSFNHEKSENIEDALLQIMMGNGIALLDYISFPNFSDSFEVLPIDKEAYQIGIDVIWKKNNLNPAIPLFTNMIQDI